MPKPTYRDLVPDVTVEKLEAPSKIILSNRVNIQSLFPAHIIKIGLVSGERYVFAEAGSVVSVDERDVPDLLAYRIGTTSCCGGSDPNGNRVFQLL